MSTKTIGNKGREKRVSAGAYHEFSESFAKGNIEQLSGDELLGTLLLIREANYEGRGKYRAPSEPQSTGLPTLPANWVWASPSQLSGFTPYSLSIGPFGSNLKVADYRESGTPLIFVRNIRSEDFTLTAKYVSEQKARELCAHMVEGGTILVTKMGDPPGDSAYYPIGAPNAIITADCIGWRLAPQLTTPKFFVYAIRSKIVQQQILDRTRGVAQKKISLERFRDLALPLPPLSVQQRIVAEIEKQFTRLDAGVAALKRAQASLKRYRAAVLKAACEGRLVPTEAELAKAGEVKANFETGEQLLARILTDRRKNWQGRGKYKEPAKPDIKGLPELPDGWTYVSVETVGFVQLGRQRAPKHHSGENMRPYLRVANVYEDRIDLGDVKEMNFTQEEFEVFRLKSNDILLNEGQSLELVGRPAIYRDELPGACFTNTLVRFRPSAALNVQFALATFRAFMHSGRFQKIANWTTNIAHLGADRFAKLAFPLPPLNEQIRIVQEVERRLSVVDELEATVTANLQRAVRLRQSILQKAFEGKLC